MDRMTMGVEEEFLVVDAETGRAGAPLAPTSCRPPRTSSATRSAPSSTCARSRSARRSAPSLDELRDHLVRLRRQLAAGGRLARPGHRRHGHPPVHLVAPPADRPPQRALQPHGRRVPDRGPPAGHLRLPRARRHRRPRPGHRGHEPGAARGCRPCWPCRPTRPSGRASTPASPATASRCGSAGPPRACRRELGRPGRLRRLVRDLEAIDAIEDATFLYWYVAAVGAVPHARVPAVRRVPARRRHRRRSPAWCAPWRGRRSRRWSAGSRSSMPSLEVMAASTWRAGRYGLDDRLVSPVSTVLRPAVDVVSELLDHVRVGLEAHGDWERRPQLDRPHPARRQRGQPAAGGDGPSRRHP